ncbi:MAG: hypothetical protein ACLFVR_00010 [Thiohalospira sp.]
MNTQYKKHEQLKMYFQNIDIKQYFGLIILIYILISILLNWFIIQDELYYKSLGEEFSTDVLNKIISLRNKWDWVGFIISPFFLFVKILLVATCLEIGNFIFDWKLQLKQLLRIVILAETIFLIVAIVRIIWFLVYPENLTLEYIQVYYPLSLINLVEIENIPQYLIYPMQLVNLFELVYWITLAYLIKIYTNKSFDKSFDFVAKTYGVGLFTWVILFVFISIN